MSDMAIPNRANGSFEVRTGLSAARVAEVVLFPFDSYSVPFLRGMRVELQSPARRDFVLEPGPPGSCDALRVQYNGTVIRIGDELRMWYLGIGDREGEDGVAHDLQVCYATSGDGIHWKKPELGLVAYGGSTANNRIRIHGLEKEDRVYDAIVMYERDDPDASRRFKMALEFPRYHGQLAVAFSPDGLDWHLSPRNPVGPLIEFSGITKVNGCYLLCGHGGTAGGRCMEILASYDFEQWTTGAAIGLCRERVGYDPNRPVNPWRPPLPLPLTEEVHIGASLWNRGNVILAVYGDWRWNPNYPGERRHCRINLGLLTSADGLHYQEPIPGFPLLSAAENWDTDREWDARLLQGQGFENMGDETFFWYGLAHRGVRLARWPRDRIACTRVHEHALRPELVPILGPPHFLSCPIVPHHPRTRVFVNLEVLSEHGQATAQLCDEQLRPLPDYAGDNVIPITESGLHVPVRWKGGDVYEGEGRAFRVRVDYGGIRPEDVRVYAVYVEKA